MERRDVRQIVQYFFEIRNMKRMLRSELDDMEALYDTVRAAGDSAGGGSGPGRPVEAAASRAEEHGARNRAAEIRVKLEVLESDEASVRTCLDGLCGRYKYVLELRHRRGYSWAKIAVSLEAPDSTVRHWYHRAILCLGEALESVPMAAELAARASRARTS